MAIQLKTDQGVSIVTASGTLDDAEGQKMQQAVVDKVLRGSNVIVDGAELTSLTGDAVFHLMAVQRWTGGADESRKLPLVGFPAPCWQAIVDNAMDGIFERRSTLEDALEAMGLSSGSGVKSAAAAGPPPAEGQEYWNETAPTKRTPAMKKTRSATTGPEDSSWSGWVPPPERPKVSQFSGKQIGAVVAGVVVLALLAVGGWRYAASRPPTLRVHPTSITVEEGREVDAVTVRVSGGTLVPSGLPQDLVFEPSEDSPDTYSLGGTAQPGAKTSEVRLEAVAPGADGKRSPAVMLTINVRAKPMSWQLNSLHSLRLTAGAPIKDYAKFITGANRVSASGLPAGLRVESVQDGTMDWQLAGTPAADGKWRVIFQATGSGGTEETKSYDLEVATALQVSSLQPAPGPGPKTSSDQGSLSFPSPSPNTVTIQLDDGLRKFFLEHIDRLPARYTDEERENLRLIVGGLSQARRIHRVIFERDGQTKVSDAEKASLRADLQSPANASLFKDPTNCQIVIVGYASTTGSYAANVQLSKARAREVEDFVQEVLRRPADLCGDYGPTDRTGPEVGQTNNRAVEIYAGTLTLLDYQKPAAEAFKRNFNRNHGVR